MNMKLKSLSRSSGDPSPVQNKEPRIRSSYYPSSAHPYAKSIIAKNNIFKQT